jgi:hypothetical protein
MHTNRRRTWVSRVLLGVAVIAATLGGVLLWTGDDDSHAEPLAVSSPQIPVDGATSAGPKLVRSNKTGPGPAGQLLIPSLNINAPLVWTSITGGQFDVPADVSSVGVWSDGARPGDPSGAIVAAGHVSDNSDRPGALHDLSAIKTGAPMQVVDDAGDTLTYTVTSVREYGQDKLPADLTTSDSPVLRVISCARRIITHGGRAFHYTDNIVITATPQGATS